MGTQNENVLILTMMKYIREVLCRVMGTQNENVIILTDDICMMVESDGHLK